jgi:hypothetical protein
MSNSEEKLPTTEDEKRSNRFSFIVGIFIAMAIIILFVVLFGAR